MATVRGPPPLHQRDSCCTEETASGAANGRTAGWSVRVPAGLFRITTPGRALPYEISSGPRAGTAAERPWQGCPISPATQKQRNAGIQAGLVPVEPACVGTLAILQVMRTPER